MVKNQAVVNPANKQNQNYDRASSEATQAGLSPAESGDSAVQSDQSSAPNLVDLCWQVLGIDPLVLSPRIVAGKGFERVSQQTGPFLIVGIDTLELLQEIKIGIGPTRLQNANRLNVRVLQEIGTASEKVFDIKWSELDIRVTPGKNTALWVPVLPASAASNIAIFDDLVHLLRERCPWDKKQTHGSLRKYLLEETYETLDVLDNLVRELEMSTASRNSEFLASEKARIDRLFVELCDELGDVLFQVLFHSVIAEEAGQFSLAEVVGGVTEKLTRRHPHVFDGSDLNSEEVAQRWEEIKSEEKPRSHILDGIPRSLPALLMAEKVLKRATSNKKYRAPVDPAENLRRLVVAFSSKSRWLANAASLTEDVTKNLEAGSRTDLEVGQILFAVVELAESLGVDADAALRRHAESLAGILPE